MSASITHPPAPGVVWPGWPALLADVLAGPRSGFRPLALRPGVVVPLACLAAVRVLALFAHFAPSLTPAKLAITTTAQGVLALVTAAAWAAAVWALLASAGTAPRFRALVALYLAAALWPGVAATVCEGAVAAVGAYPDTFDPRVHHVTSLVWLVPAGAAPLVRALANAFDGPALYRDVLLALGVPQVEPAVSRRAAAGAVAVVAAVRMGLAAATT